MRRILALVLAAILGGTGCSLLHPAKKAPEAPAATAPVPGTPSATPAPKTSFLGNVFSGFGLTKKLFPPKKQPPKALPIQRIGTVKMVNKEEKFVIIDALVSQNLNTGTVLVCISGQNQTATLRMSTLRNPPFLIADITDGDPSPGDQVFVP